MAVTTAEAWDLWREACCDEQGGHWWDVPMRLEHGHLTLTCERCPVTMEIYPVVDKIRLPWGSVATVRTGVCRLCFTKFRWADLGEQQQAYCSPAHRETAHAKRKRARKRKAAALARQQAKRDATCRVCGGKFQSSDEEQRFCSDPCREFAQQHRHVQTARLPRLWELEGPCPSGKVKHPNRIAAMEAAKHYVRLRYSAFPRWLTAYRCDTCFCWHLTSKPRSRRPLSA